MDKNYQYLHDKFRYINDLNHALEMLCWDEDVMMPVGGAKARNSALASLTTTIHQQLNSPEVASRLQDVDDSALDQWQLANIKHMRKAVVNATILPEHLVADLAVTTKESTQAWRTLRGQNNWHDFMPLLSKTVALVKQKAKIKAEYYGVDAYDALLDEFSPGVNRQYIDPIFDELKHFLPQTIPMIIDKQSSKVSLPFNQSFAIDKQYALSQDLMRVIGFDFNHGRIDTSQHPFCGGVPSDVRITTRYNEQDFLSSALAVCHETGHALYEMGLPQKYITQPVAKALGMAVHESQSLLVEMQACSSPEFIAILAKYAQRHFGQNDSLSKDNLMMHLLKVRPDFIRVDADEVTYPLHVILRYEIEKALFTDEITVADLPAIWQEKMSAYLGVDTTNNYKDGVMQDVHWSSGDFGYFPSYALGALLAAQLFAEAKRSNPEIMPSIARGDFKPLMSWLNHNIHQYGSLYTFDELVTKASGKSLDASAYIAHVKARYMM